MLPVGNTSCHGSGDELCRTSSGGKQHTSQSRVPRIPATSEEASNLRQVVGTTTTVLEPSWDVDHDYSSRVHHTKQDSNERLTPAEEEFITQLTSALDEVPNSNVKCTSLEEAAKSQAAKDVSTPDIVNDIFDFGMDSNIFEVVNASTASVNSSESHKENARVESPVSKDQILDYLQDQVMSTSPQSLFGSESGYESSSSPKYFASDDEQNIDFDVHSFSELFPTLF